MLLDNDDFDTPNEEEDLDDDVEDEGEDKEETVVGEKVKETLVLPSETLKADEDVAGKRRVNPRKLTEEGKEYYRKYYADRKMVWLKRTIYEHLEQYRQTRLESMGDIVWRVCEDYEHLKVLLAKAEKALRETNK